MVDDVAVWAKRTARDMVSTMDVGAARVNSEVSRCPLRVRRAVLEEILLVTVQDELQLVKGIGGARA